MVKLQKGGAKLLHPDKIGFKPIFDMLTSPGAILKLLSNDSRYGFIFELIVRSEYTEYYTNDATGMFKIPITNFILKIVVIASLKVNLPKCGSKYSVIAKEFLDEAKNQQLIWLKSIAGGRPEICPAVANLSLFNKDEADKLIDFLSDKSDAPEIFECLKETLESMTHAETMSHAQVTCGMGIMLMPKVMWSSTVYEFMNRNRDVNSVRQELDAISNILAQVVRLFIDIGIIHRDLHKRNVLLYPSTIHIQSEIIDFGNVINVNQEQYLIDKKEEMTRRFFEIITSHEQPVVFSLPLKEEFMHNALKYIYAVNQSEKYIVVPGKLPNMQWLVDTADSVPVVYSLSFDILQKYYIASVDNPTQMTEDIINSYIRAGELANFDKDIETFYVSLPSPLPTTAAEMSSFDMRVESAAQVHEGAETDVAGGNKSRRKQMPPRRRKRRQSKRHNVPQLKRTCKRGKKRPRSKRI